MASRAKPFYDWACDILLKSRFDQILHILSLFDLIQCNDTMLLFLFVAVLVKTLLLFSNVRSVILLSPFLPTQRQLKGPWAFGKSLYFYFLLCTFTRMNSYFHIFQYIEKNMSIAQCPQSMLLYIQIVFWGVLQTRFQNVQ